ncbi:hypothetical protein SISSUDRAFT_1068088 [Sistotremastrum suecicum HHB10207 ss-3]|uniref:Uncharacterized protein n=1 Tax=Sistotremastrum suecicum HHB10207 ss-3 TaxID=1314776 RepID=A0A165WG01_9AGAM|nr:hypothetical protein SISSUDRAFT_1068088 [Sistotremastrum suecicum HHB10207 ss-3]
MLSVTDQATRESAEAIWRSLGATASHIAYGMLALVWLTTLSFSPFPKIGLLTALNTTPKRRDSPISLRITIYLALMFLLATMAVVSTVLNGILNLDMEPSDSWEWNSVVPGVATVAMTALSAAITTYRLYIVFCGDHSVLIIPSFLVLTGSACGLPILHKIADPSREYASAVQFTLATVFYSAFIIHSVVCTTLIARRLLGEEARLMSLIALRISAVVPLHSLRHIPSITANMDASGPEIRKEYRVLTRIIVTSTAFYTIFLFVTVLAYMLQSPLRLLLLPVIPQITALAASLSLLQVAISITYRVRDTSNEVVLTFPRFAFQ